MLIDGHGRKVNYLRVSVTERCNFRCQYCMPEKPFSWVPQENLLSFEELFRFVRIAIDEGVDKIRITGGEPLLRYDLDSFIKMIHDYSPDIDLALTTNGYLLPEVAHSLKKAGLKRLNISLDSLKPATAARIAQKTTPPQRRFSIRRFQPKLPAAVYNVPAGHNHRQKKRPRHSPSPISPTGGNVQKMPPYHERAAIESASATRLEAPGTTRAAQ